MKSAAAAFGILTALAIGELLVRLFLPAPLPWKYPQVQFVASEELIFALKPHQQTYTADKPVRTNERGLRGRSLPHEKPKDTVRILMLGDSVVFGFAVREEDTVSVQLERILTARGIKAEVINAAVPGYNTPQEIAYLRTDGLLYDPDWVVLGYYWNDINKKRGVLVTDDGALVSDRDDLERSKTFLARLERSPLSFALRNAVKRSRLLYGLMQLYARVSARNDSPSSHAVLRMDVLSGNTSRRVEAGYARVDAALAELVTMSRERGFAVAMAVWPAPLTFKQEFGKDAFPVRVSALAKRHDLPVIDLEQTFRPHFDGHASLFVPYDGDHPHAQGHLLAAKAIAAFLLEHK